MPCQRKSKRQKQNKTRNSTQQTVHHIWEGCNGREGTLYLVRYISCYTFCYLPPALLRRSRVLSVLSVYHSPTLVPMNIPPPGLVVFCFLRGAAFAVSFGRTSSAGRLFFLVRGGHEIFRSLQHPLVPRHPIVRLRCKSLCGSVNSECKPVVHRRAVRGSERLKVILETIGWI